MGANLGGLLYYFHDYRPGIAIVCFSDAEYLGHHAFTSGFCKGDRRAHNNVDCICIVATVLCFPDTAGKFLRQRAMHHHFELHSESHYGACLLVVFHYFATIDRPLCTQTATVPPETCAADKHFLTRRTGRLHLLPAPFSF